jgi:hypothetical protein
VAQSASSWPLDAAPTSRRSARVSSGWSQASAPATVFRPPEPLGAGRRFEPQPHLHGATEMRVKATQRRERVVGKGTRPRRPGEEQSPDEIGRGRQQGHQDVLDALGSQPLGVELGFLDQAVAPRDLQSEHAGGQQASLRHSPHRVHIRCRGQFGVALPKGLVVEFKLVAQRAARTLVKAEAADITAEGSAHLGNGLSPTSCIERALVDQVNQAQQLHFSNHDVSPAAFPHAIRQILHL